MLGRLSWKKDPDLKYTHPDGLKKEYYLGMHTGDYICPIYGEDFTSEEKKQMKKQEIGD